MTVSSTVPGWDAETTAVAREIGFGQSVLAVQHTLRTLPIGWLLVYWFAREHVRPVLLLTWIGGFSVVFVLSLWLLRGILRAGPNVARHGHLLALVAALDGCSWGSLSWLIGADPTLDAWGNALLCGVCSINGLGYTTYQRGYLVLAGSLWGTVVVAATVRTGHPIEPQFIAGLTLFAVLMGLYVRPVAQRLLEGICLQLHNASLAEQLQAALKNVREEASTDPLTGQPNRRALDVLLGQQLALARSRGRPFCALLLDIDHFKRINDEHGHVVGDHALRAFARRVREQLREGDTCARYGGEEFVVVLPDTTLAIAVDVAERLRRGLSREALLESPRLVATVSIGVSQVREGDTMETLLERADTAVYAAKRGGRDQVRAPVAELA